MGRTLETATQIILQEHQAFSVFRCALRRSDQRAFEELFAYARKHLAAVSQAAHALPFEVILLAMMVEQQKDLTRLRRLVEGVDAS
jgi:hypothetical protein